MGVTIQTTTVANPTASGTQDITISGFGTPKAVIFKWIRAGVGASEAGVHFGFGATDGINQWAVEELSENGVSTTNTNQSLSASHVVVFASESASFTGQASFDSWITDGVRINWNLVTPSSYTLHITLFGGDDIQASVGLIPPASLATSDTIEITTGFQTNVCFVNHTEAGTIAENQGWLEYCWGFFTYDGSTIRQNTTFLYSDPGAGATFSDGYVSDTDFGVTCQVTDVTDASFTITATSAVGATMGYVALNLGAGFKAYTSVIDTPTATGTISYTDSGLRPTYIEINGSTIEVLNIEEFGSNVLFAHGSSDGIREHSLGFGEEQGATTTNNWSRSSTEFCNVPGASLVASVSQFLDNGYELNFSAVEAAAKKCLVLVIGEVVTSYDPSNGQINDMSLGISI